jgi:hypothetical protein
MTDSDSEAGKEMEEYDEEEETQVVPKKKKDKTPSPLKEKLEPPNVTTEIVQPIPTPPLPTTPPPKLTKERRDQIIRDFQAGKEDGEYSVKPRKDGRFIVTKRQTFYTPSARVDTPSHEEIMERFAKQMREEMKQNRELIMKKYKKYRDRQRQIEFTPWPPEQMPPPVFEQEGRRYNKPLRPVGKYKAPKLDIRNF